MLKNSKKEQKSEELAQSNSILYPIYLPLNKSWKSSPIGQTNKTR